MVGHLSVRYGTFNNVYLGRGKNIVSEELLVIGVILPGEPVPGCRYRVFLYQVFIAGTSKHVDTFGFGQQIEVAADNTWRTVSCIQYLPALPNAPFGVELVAR